MSDQPSAVPQEILDGLAAETQKMGGAPQTMAEPPKEAEDDPSENPDAPVVEDDVPDDFKSYEQYVEDGGDPEYYRGPKAFKQQKEILDELKGVKEKFKRFEEDAVKFDKFREQEKERLLNQLEDQKKKAREDLDFDAYDDLEKQRRQIEEGPEAEASESQEPPVIATYRNENPELNPAAPEFDPVYASAFAGAFNAVVSQAQQRAGRSLTDQEVQTHLETVKKRLGGGEAAPAKRPSKVEGARRPNKAQAPADKMPAEVKAMHDRWINHHDAAKREYAKTLAKQYGG